MATMNQINLLRLAPRAKTGAILLNERFPEIVFTSGLRDISKQAQVMAKNQLRDPQWIGKTYLRGAELQSALDANAQKVKDPKVLNEFILNYLKNQSDIWLAGLSRHLGGYAFDVEPVVDVTRIPTARGWKIVEFMRRSIGAEKVLLREGNEVIWHVQFTPTEEV